MWGTGRGSKSELQRDKKQLWGEMGMSTVFTGVKVSQVYTHVEMHPAVYSSLLRVNYTSIKLLKNKASQPETKENQGMGKRRRGKKLAVLKVVLTSLTLKLTIKLQEAKDSVALTKDRQRAHKNRSERPERRHALHYYVISEDTKTIQRENYFH